MACTSGNLTTVTPSADGDNVVSFVPATDGYPFEDPEGGSISDFDWWVEAYYFSGTESSVGTDALSIVRQPSHMTVALTSERNLVSGKTQAYPTFSFDIDDLPSGVTEIKFGVSVEMRGGTQTKYFCCDVVVTAATTGDEWAQVPIFLDNSAGGDDIHIMAPAPFRGGNGLGFDPVTQTGGQIRDIVWWDDDSGATSDENGAFLVGGTGITGVRWWNPDTRITPSLTLITDSPTDNVDGLDVDQTNNIVYWSGRTSRKVGKFTLSGTVATTVSATSKSEITLSVASGSPRHLSIHPTSGKIIVFTSLGEVVQLETDLTGETVLFTVSSVSGPVFAEVNENDGLLYYNSGTDIRKCSATDGSTDTLVKASTCSVFWNARMKYNAFVDETYIYISGGLTGTVCYEVGADSIYTMCNFRDGSRVDTHMSVAKGRPIPGWLKEGNSWVVFVNVDPCIAAGVSGGSLGMYDLSGRGAHTAPATLQTSDTTLYVMQGLHVDDANSLLYSINTLDTTCGSGRERISVRSLADFVEDAGVCLGADTFDSGSCPTVDLRDTTKVLYFDHDTATSFAGDLVQAVGATLTGQTALISGSNDIDNPAFAPPVQLDDDGDSSYNWLYFLDGDDDDLKKINLTTFAISIVHNGAASTFNGQILCYDPNNDKFFAVDTSASEIVTLNRSDGTKATWEDVIAVSTVEGLCVRPSDSLVIWNGDDTVSYNNVLTSTFVRDYAKAQNPFFLWNFHREIQSSSTGTYTYTFTNTDHRSLLV